MNNTEKRTTQSTKDEFKQKKTTCVGHHYAQTNIDNVNKTYRIQHRQKFTWVLPYSFVINVYFITCIMHEI